MPSINDISIAINSLFMDISEPITLGLNKADFLKIYKKTFFRFTDGNFFEFNTSPILRFDDTRSLKGFLAKEEQLATNYQDVACASDIEALKQSAGDALVLDSFYLDYTVEINGDEVVILFNTNSMVFKYEVIG